MTKSYAGEVEKTSVDESSRTTCMSEVDITYSDSENSTAIQLYNGWK
jgi:hypothetical protein